MPALFTPDPDCLIERGDLVNELKKLRDAYQSEAGALQTMVDQLDAEIATRRLRILRAIKAQDTALAMASKLAETLRAYA